MGGGEVEGWGWGGGGGGGGGEAVGVGGMGTCTTWVMQSADALGQQRRLLEEISVIVTLG